jgi:hypothetical protein
MNHSTSMMANSSRVKLVLRKSWEEKIAVVVEIAEIVVKEK